MYDFFPVFEQIMVCYLEKSQHLDGVEIVSHENGFPPEPGLSKNEHPLIILLWPL